MVLYKKLIKQFNIMDLNGFFSLNDDEIEKNMFLEEELKKYSGIVMFTKLIINYRTFSKGIIGFFSKCNSELDVDEIKRAGEIVMFNRAWDYIKEFDIEKDSGELKYHTHYETLIAFGRSISHFEKNEDYEKCGFLLPIKNKLLSIILEEELGYQKENP
jgi:hypothetical protein